MFFLISLLLVSSIEDAEEKYHSAINIENPLKAMEEFQEIVKEYPDTPYEDSSLFRIAMFYYLLEDYEQTINSLDVIYKKGSSSSLYKKANKWLHISYMNTGDTAKAGNYELSIDTVDADTLSPVEKSDTLIKSEGKVWAVQLSAYRNREWAENFLKTLDNLDIEAYIIKDENFIKVCSGEFSTRTKAVKWLEHLQNKGFDGFIVRIKR